MVIRSFIDTFKSTQKHVLESFMSSKPLKE